jgi:hypothetical protein
VQSVLSAAKNVKFHSSLTQTDQSIVEIVGQKEDEQVVSATKRLREHIFSKLFYFFFILSIKNCNNQRFSVWCPRNSGFS